MLRDFLQMQQHLCVSLSEMKCSRALWFLGQQAEAQRDSLPPHMRAEMLPGTGGACTASLFFVSAERPEAWVTEHVKRAPFTCQSNGKNANQTLRCFNYVKRAGYTTSSLDRRFHLLLLNLFNIISALDSKIDFNIS